MSVGGGIWAEAGDNHVMGFVALKEGEPMSRIRE